MLIMKRTLAVIITMVTLFFVCVSAVYATGYDTEMLTASGFSIGDVNMDHRLSITDATSIQKYLAELVELNEEQLVLADTDISGMVNIKDATCIQKQLAGIIGGEKPTVPNTQPTTQPITDSDEPIELPFVPAL